MGTLAAGFLFLALLVCLFYVFIMALLCAGWHSVKSFKPSPAQPRTRISIVIAARNEEMNIAACISSIAGQAYPQHLFEVIIIDDGSGDNTFAIAEKCKAQFSGVNIHIARSGGEGKKQALSQGIAAAKGALVVTTDADTVRGSLWLSELAAFFEEKDPVMIIGPVAYAGETTMLEKLQGLELTGLVAVGAATAQLGMPVLCNGANLAFTREVFDAVGGYGSNSKIASGDDVMLMTTVHSIYPGKVKFLHSKNAIVHTSACAGLRELMHQRIRWASKNRAAYNSASVIIGMIVLAFNLAILAGMLASAFHHQLLAPVLILFGVKCLIDFLFLFLATSFFGKRRFLLLFVPAQFWNILYISVAGILSMFMKYEWKGRKQG
jgi:cellulose synthase/poly-beta-1,6-N-acetylglucosamine synthase-like glycosyltransferase